MNKKVSIACLMALFSVLVLMEGCRIEITVPEGGKVVSSSHAYDCGSGETCVVEINDFYFEQKFDAHAWEGWLFVGWKLGQNHLCQRSERVCHLSNKGLEDYEAIAAIVESDEMFYLEPGFVKGTPFDEALANVQDEGLRACLNAVPPPKRYAEQLTQLECGTLRSLEGIEAFTGLERLILDDFENELIDLEPLAELIRLKYLALIGNEDDETFSDVSNLVGPLSALTQLEELDLSRNGIGDLSPLADTFAGLKRLKYLDLHSNEFSDITPLAELTRLLSLNLLDNPFLSDISPLAGLKRLQSLDTGGSSVSDISSLAGLAQMQFLRIGGGGNIPDLTPLAGLAQLRSLALYSGGIDDIRALSGLTEMTSLDLPSNSISDISPLAGLTKLRSLDLSRNKIGDIRPLAGLMKLKSLDLQWNQISTVGDLLDFMTRGDVYLSGNPLSCAEAQSLVLDDEPPTVHYFPLPRDFPPDAPPPIPIDCV